MACSDKTYVYEWLLEFNFREAFRCSIEGGFGGSAALFASLFLGAVFLSIYIKTEDIVLTWAALVCTSGVVTAWLFPPAITILVILVLGVGGGGIIALVRRGTPRV